MTPIPTHSTKAARPVCTLVGAGPGDPDLLTLAAWRAIQQASVLFVDDLVGDAIVALASPSARVVWVGKRGGCRSTPQSFIDRLMAQAAVAGERVVRLKGGDPFIFGRGGEEADKLRAAGIEVRIINGVTSGLAAATSLGVPLTHRDHAHGVLLLTGHAKAGASGNDWPTLAATAIRCKLTLVIYMGMAQVEEIQAGLLTQMPAQTPAAVVQFASTAQERQMVCRLGDLSRTLRQQSISSPAVILIGDVLQGVKALKAQQPVDHAA